ncbi:MAG: D-alanyl-D-alanine carboxypeptidase [Candidatus Hydrogenedentes bacterium]|nr:D-alanyl-D-alanine carboxypeptidase [Candidatus Hydrogenedentota bacterium]
MIVSEQAPDEPRAPASMVKMMQMLLVAEGLQNGLWEPEAKIAISGEVQAIGGAQAYLKAGEEWTLAQLMGAVSVCSANDAALAIAEGLWESEDAYLQAANARAVELGMQSTVLYSPHGLPPSKGEEQDVTTARDLAILARQCVGNPLVMEWVGREEFALRDGDPAKSNTNRLLTRMDGCDGLKTGYTQAAGYCLAATAVRDGLRLIAVVMGCDSLNARFEVAERVLEDGFASVQKVRLIAKGERVDTPVSVDNCRRRSLQPVVAEDLWSAVPQDALDKVELVAMTPPRVCAPLPAGTEIGTLQAQLDGIVLASAPLLVPRELDEPGWRWKIEYSVLDRLGAGS